MSSDKSNIIDPKKRFNHRWKTDPKYLKGFNYDSPQYADVPDDLKWAIPLSEGQDSAEFKQLQKDAEESAKRSCEKNGPLKLASSRQLAVVR